MKLTDMKHVPSKKPKETKAMLADGPSGPSYPYGLQLRLDHDSLEKLKLANLPKVGGTVPITAEAKITSVSQNEDGDRGMRRSVEMQITKLSLGTPKGKASAADCSDDEASDSLYGGKKK